MSCQQSQTKTIRTYLVNAMKSGQYANRAHLPPEKELAEELGISRTQLRDILAALEREGFITRRHGVGTLINRHVLDAPNRMDIETEFLDMIRQCGFQPAATCLQVSEQPADSETAHCLRIEVGAPVIRVANLCTADGTPAIYWEDVFAKSLIKEPCTLEDCKQLIFHFVEKFCGVSAYMDLTDIRPVVTDSTLAQHLQIPVGTPVLNLKEVDFDIDGNPIFCSYQYFVNGVFHHTVLRKKL